VEVGAVIVFVVGVVVEATVDAAGVEELAEVAANEKKARWLEMRDLECSDKDRAIWGPPP